MLQKLIENYTPSNEQEASDKQNILKLMNTYNDLLHRTNEFAHFTSSSFVFNKAKDKCLMIYHNIYDSWAWTGGHNDGDPDPFNVAAKELVEETGITNFKPISKEIFALDIMGVNGHVKRGKYVSTHLHLNTTFVFEADEQDTLTANPEENSGVQWIKISELQQKVRETHMLPIYNKIINKVLNLNN